MLYQKPYHTVPEQIELLKSRGMIVEDEAKAGEYLRRIGYYRLSAYSFSFRQSSPDTNGNLIALDQFKEGTTFANVTDLYAFDKALRLSVLDAVERIEISLRSEVALCLGSYDPWAHRQSKFLDRKALEMHRGKRVSMHEEWLSILDTKARESKEEFAVHFRSKYAESDMPIWIAVELLDFGPLSHFLSFMTFTDARKIARSYAVDAPKTLTGWVKTLSFVRNVCAHHSRIWNKALVNQPPLPNRGAMPLLDHLRDSPYENKRLYSALCVMRYLLMSANPRTKWHMRLKDHIATFPKSPHISIKTMGFPEDWQLLPLWK